MRQRPRVNQFNALLTIPDIIAERDSIAGICLDQGDELRRLILATDPPDTVSVNEGESLQFTATADFQFGDDQDVTTIADWSVDRPEAGSIDGEGLFTASDVSGDTCITISATFSSDGVQRTNTRRIIIVDLDQARAIVLTDPPDGAIDARQPHALDDPLARFGWTEIVLTFACHISEPSPFDFVLTASDTERDAPEVENVVLLDGHTVRLELSEPIDPGAWTMVTHEPTGARLCLGYLPGDVTGDGITAVSDIAALIDSINRVEGLSRPPYAADIDRSGVVGPQDILRLIDLLNGAATLDPWITRTLAVSPCD
ncbi:MAG: hypothetical protein IH897_04970 [Planctomycetes bacterium]|nr:hypothetical protein [Planctomycetota bacterium]